MAFERIARGDSKTIMTEQYICETAEDAENLPENSPFGSMALVIDDDGKLGMRIKTSEWKKV